MPHIVASNRYVNDAVIVPCCSTCDSQWHVGMYARRTRQHRCQVSCCFYRVVSILTTLSQYHVAGLSKGVVKNLDFLVFLQKELKA